MVTLWEPVDGTFASTSDDGASASMVRGYDEVVT
jgi:hypothetical protein